MNDEIRNCDGNAIETTSLSKKPWHAPGINRSELRDKTKLIGATGFDGETVGSVGPD